MQSEERIKNMLAELNKILDGGTNKREYFYGATDYLKWVLWDKKTQKSVEKIMKMVEKE